MQVGGGCKGTPAPGSCCLSSPACACLGGAGGHSRSCGEGGCSSLGTPKSCSGQGGGPGLPSCLLGAISRPPAALRGREQFADFACTALGTGQTDPQHDPNPHAGYAATGSRDPTVGMLAQMSPGPQLPLGRQDGCTFPCVSCTCGTSRNPLVRDLLPVSPVLQGLVVRDGDGSLARGPRCQLL